MCGDGRIRPSRRAKLDEAKFDVPDATIHAMTRILLVLFLTTFLTAQSAPEVEITAEPHHHLVFANDQVSVFNVDVAPHTETLLHRHGHDYFYVMFGACEIVNAVQSKDPVNVSLHDAQVGFTPGDRKSVV